MSEELNIEKSTEKYWSDFWKNHSLPEPIDVTAQTLGNYPYRVTHNFYLELFKELLPQPTTIFEVGCGNSVWLSYFNKNFNFQVAGIDYSKFGCEQTRKILTRDGITGEIHYGDLFSPPKELLNSFDAVCSFGVVEHFSNTEDAIKHVGKFMKDDGILITTIPNLCGIAGWLQKIMNKPVYDIHKVMTLAEITKAVENAGFKIIKSELVNPISFGVTLDEINEQKVKFLKIKKMILKIFQVVELLARFLDDRIIKLPKTELFCAGMIVVAKKNKAE